MVMAAEAMPSLVWTPIRDVTRLTHIIIGMIFMVFIQLFDKNEHYHRAFHEKITLNLNKNHMVA